MVVVDSLEIKWVFGFSLWIQIEHRGLVEAKSTGLPETYTEEGPRDLGQGSRFYVVLTLPVSLSDE